MLDFSEEFGSDDKASIEGVWVDMKGGASVKIARLGNPEAQRAYKKIPRHIRRAIEEETMTEGQSLDFLAKYMNDILLHDWRKMTENGKKLEYSSVNGLKMLKKHRRFRDRVWAYSQNEDLFNVNSTEIETDTKN